jgi:hypothetical protein
MLKSTAGVVAVGRSADLGYPQLNMGAALLEG